MFLRPREEFFLPFLIETYISFVIIYRCFSSIYDRRNNNNLLLNMGSVNCKAFSSTKTAQDDDGKSHKEISLLSFRFNDVDLN